jgi:hypothetical protein
MTAEKMRDGAKFYTEKLHNHGVTARVMGGNEKPSEDVHVARNQLLGHALFIFSLKIPTLLIEMNKKHSSLSCQECHLALGEQFGFGKALLLCTGFSTLGEL